MILTEVALAPVLVVDLNTGEINITKGSIIYGDGVELTRLRHVEYFKPDELNEAKTAFGEHEAAATFIDSVADLQVAKDYVQAKADAHQAALDNALE